MIDRDFGALLLLALVAGLGVLLIYAGATNAAGALMQRAFHKVGAAQTPAPVVTDLPPLLQRALGGLLVDLGAWLFRRRNRGPLENRLRRSGGRYQSAEDYFGSQMAMMMLGFLFGIGVCFLFNLPPQAMPFTAAAFGALAAFIPEQNVTDAIEKRREALFIEMAWTLDRLAAALRGGKGLEFSIDRVVQWSAGSGGGLFVALLRDIAAGLSTGGLNFDGYIDELRRALPDDLPELDEFLQIVKLNKKGQPVAAQMQALAATMRDRMSNRIQTVAQKAKQRVTLLGAGLIMFITFILAGAVPFLMFLTQ